MGLGKPTLASVARIIEQGAAEQDQILAEVESAGLIDPPQNRLRMETPEDRLLVMEFLYDTGRGGIDLETWGRLNPEKAKRVLEIFPKKPEYYEEEEARKKRSG